MDDLAAELGMSKKTIYSRFDSKLQLVHAVVEHKFGRVRKDFEAIIAEQGDFPKTLRKFPECMQRHTSEIQPPFIRDIRQEGPGIFEKVERLRQANIQRFFGELMRKGQRGGFIRKDIPIDIIIEILLAAAQAIINPQRMEELGLTVKAGCNLITKIVLEGAFVPDAKRRKEIWLI
jgi:AcrR family transcriptional regulator